MLEALHLFHEGIFWGLGGFLGYSLAKFIVEVAAKGLAILLEKIAKKFGWDETVFYEEPEEQVIKCEEGTVIINVKN